MAIDRQIKASAAPEAEGVHGPSKVQSQAPAGSEDALPISDSDGYDQEDGRSLAFVYVMVAFFIGLGAVGWAISAMF